MIVHRKVARDQKGLDKCQNSKIQRNYAQSGMGSPSQCRTGRPEFPPVSEFSSWTARASSCRRRQSTATTTAKQIVYNDFDQELLMEHAAGNSDTDNDLKDDVGNNEDVDSEDESVNMPPV
jgi:hypothetical protein